MTDDLPDNIEFAQFITKRAKRCSLKADASKHHGKHLYAEELNNFLNPHCNSVLGLNIFIHNSVKIHTHKKVQHNERI